MVSITSLSSEDEYRNEARIRNRQGGRGGGSNSFFRFVLFGAQKRRWWKARRRSPPTMATKAIQDALKNLSIEAPTKEPPQHERELTQRTVCSLASSAQFASLRSTPQSSFRTAGLDANDQLSIPKFQGTTSLHLHETSWERNPIDCLGYLHSTTYRSIDEAVEGRIQNDNRIFYVYYDPVSHSELDTSELSNILSDPLLVEALEWRFVCIHVTTGESTTTTTTSSIPTMGVVCNGHVSREVSLFDLSPPLVWSLVVDACQQHVPKFVQLLHSEAMSEPAHVTILTNTITELEESLGKHNGILRIKSERHYIPIGQREPLLGVSAMVITYDSRIVTFSQVLRFLISNPNISIHRIVCQTNEQIVAARLEVTRSPHNITIARETFDEPKRPLSAAASYRHLQRSPLRFVPMSCKQALKINSILQTPEHMHLAMQCLSPRQVSIARKCHNRTCSVFQMPLKLAWDVVHNDYASTMAK